MFFFSQDCHDTMLEVERMKELNMKALIIQKVLRGHKYRYGTKSCNIIIIIIFSSYDLPLHVCMIHGL